MQANQKGLIWTVVLCSVVLLVAGFLAVGSIKNAMPEAPVIDIPTAAEVAALIVIPAAPEAQDTMYSVYNEKRALAIELAEDEMNDRDVKEDLAREINDELGIDIDYKDIESIEVRDVDTDDGLWSVFSDEADVDFVVKVSFDDYGDMEWVKIHVYCDIEDLNWDEGYEDAEVSNCHVGDVISDSY